MSTTVNSLLSMLRGSGSIPIGRSCPEVPPGAQSGHGQLPPSTANTTRRDASWKSSKTSTAAAQPGIDVYIGTLQPEACHSQNDISCEKLAA